ncbi:MAG: glycine betaine ABC transporter substrate-binding protein, partial [Myxococcales bacterium]
MKRMYRVAVALGLALLLGSVPTRARAEPTVRVGSKKFTESVILGELARHLLERAAPVGVRVEHVRELGGSQVLFSALQTGDLDVYPEYTGTVAEELLGGRAGRTMPQLRRALLERGVVMGAPLGFDNTYALGMREAHAAALGIERISDLRRLAGLRYGFTSEFMNRGDGWPGLSARYGLAPPDVRGLDHDLAYRALSQGDLDVIDLYSTDADIEYYDLRVLEDDLAHFPEYQALFLYRAELVERQRWAGAATEQLAGTLDAVTMRRLNAAVKLREKPESEVAADFLRAALAIESAPAVNIDRTARLLLHSRDHLTLVASSLAAALLLALPLGIVAARRRRLGQAILAATGVLQTIPSLALLVFMIPLFGIGAPPAIMALFLYSLLPIVRNTHAGLTG